MHAQTNKKDANCVCGAKETINHYLIEYAMQGSHTPFWEWGRGPWDWEN